MFENEKILETQKSSNHAGLRVMENFPKCQFSPKILSKIVLPSMYDWKPTFEKNLQKNVKNWIKILILKIWFLGANFPINLIINMEMYPSGWRVCTRNAVGRLKPAPEFKSLHLRQKTISFCLSSLFFIICWILENFGI